jgi:zinc protease
VIRQRVRYLAFTACLAAASNGWANMGDNSHRSLTAGIDLITYQTSVKQVVIIVGALPAGDAMSGSDNIAIPTLTGMMLDRGTKTLDKFAIAKQLDDVGAEMSFGVGEQSLEIRAKCLKKDLPLVLRLMAAELREPAMLASEFTKARQQFIGTLQESMHNTEERAREAFARAIFPDGHPNRPHSLEEFLTAAKSVTLDQAKKFHARYYGPAHLTLVLAGDVPAADAQAEIAKDFAGWTGGQDYIHPAKPATSPGPSQVVVPLKDKPSVSVILGQPTGLRYRDPDALPLRVGTAVLGRGFTGRLMRIVRDKEGLTYNIDAEVTEDSIADGAWDISASFAPALLDKGLASTRRVLDAWWQEGVTEDELAVRKQGILGTYLVGLATTRGIASIILTTVQRGYDLDWLDAYPHMIQALTRDQVNKAIRTHLDPSTMVLIEAGSVAAGGKPAADSAPATH